MPRTFAGALAALPLVLTACGSDHPSPRHLPVEVVVEWRLADGATDSISQTIDANTFAPTRPHTRIVAMPLNTDAAGDPAPVIWIVVDVTFRDHFKGGDHWLVEFDALGPSANATKKVATTTTFDGTTPVVYTRWGGRFESQERRWPSVTVTLRPAPAP